MTESNECWKCKGEGVLMSDGQCVDCYDEKIILNDPLEDMYGGYQLNTERM